MKYLLVASAGGHYSELLKIDLVNDPQAIIITEKIKNKTYPKNTKFLKHCSRQNLFTYPFFFGYNALKSLYFIIKYRPQIIISTGAHSCVSFFYFAKLFKIKSIYIESFAKVNSPSLTYKLIKPVASKVLVQHQELSKIYPQSIYVKGVY